MNLPFLSGVCVTYGRVAWLQEAIQLFLNQDYRGPKELIVLNTFPEQRLRCEAEGVKVFNLEQRPPSLGEARNRAIELAQGTHMITVDDDDVMLCHHFSTYAEHFGEHDWLWLDKEFYAEGEEIRGIVQGSCPLFAFKKAAWRAIGGYAAMGVGEDRNFISRMTVSRTGRKVEISGLPTFIYRWGQGTWHFSGKGEHPGAHKDIEDELSERIKKGREPVGEIRLAPQVKLDWRAKAEAFVNTGPNRSKKNLADDVAIVLLGRYGDIINALPIARHIAENYRRPHWIVSKEFAGVFDGISYVEPRLVDLKNHQLRDAIAFAERHYRHIICAQIWGQNWEQTRVCESYNRESWRMCGFAHKFDDKTWRPVFDRRDYVAEAAFYRKISPEGKNLILANVSRSVSSPFRHGVWVLAALRKAWPQLNIVDVSDWQLPRIYDLLGLMERAVAVVSIDTALLHLAAACNVPIVAIVNPSPWAGSELRGNQFVRMSYNAFGGAAEGIAQINTAIESALTDMSSRALPAPSIVREAPHRQIFHVVERHNESNPVEKRRKSVAWRSWDDLYASGELVPAHLWDYPRNALSIGDPRNLPYVKDVISAGLNQAAEDDIVMFTNDDNVLHPLLPDLVRVRASIYGCCSSARCEFVESEVPPLNNKPEMFAINSRIHMGRDLFAATVRWWREHWEQIPDHIIGASDWDLNLAAIMRSDFGDLTTHANLHDVMFPADLPRGYIMHKYHAAKWAEPTSVNTMPSNLHNRALFRQWAAKYQPQMSFHANGTL